MDPPRRLAACMLAAALVTGAGAVRSTPDIIAAFAHDNFVINNSVAFQTQRGFRAVSTRATVLSTGAPKAA